MQDETRISNKDYIDDDNYIERHIIFAHDYAEDNVMKVVRDGRAFRFVDHDSSLATREEGSESLV